MKKFLAALLALTMLSTVMLTSVFSSSAAEEAPLIDAAAPTKTVDGSINVKSDGGTAWQDGVAYVGKDNDEFNTYAENLTVSADVNFTDLGEWAQFIMYLDSWDCNQWGGYQLRIEGGNAASGNTGNAINAAAAALTLYKGNAPDSPDWKYVAGAALDAESLDNDFENKDYRLIVQRVAVKNTDETYNTTLKVWLFEKSAAIPAEPTLTYTSNIGPSAGVKFTTWDRVDATVSNIKLYADEVQVKAPAPTTEAATTTTTEAATTTTTEAAATTTTAVIDPTAPVKTVAGPIHIKTDGNQSWQEGIAYIAQGEEGKYNPALTVEYTVTEEDHGEWAQLIMYLDSWDCNQWGGYQLRIEGGDTAYGNSGGAVDADMALTLYKGNAPDSPDWKYVAGVAIDKLEYDKAYRVAIQRVIGDTDTTLKVWIFEDGAAIPAEPTLAYTVDNATYGSASAGVKFTTWDRVDAVVTDLKLYNTVFDDVIPGYKEAVDDTTTTTKADDAAATMTDDAVSPTTDAAGGNPSTGAASMAIPAAALLISAAAAVAARRKKA